MEDGNPVSALSPKAAAKRRKKLRYAKQPLFWRSFANFIYRYFFKLGFTEGKEGFIWHFLPGWWYRRLVDARIREIKKACGTDKVKIKEYISKEYGLEIYTREHGFIIITPVQHRWVLNARVNIPSGYFMNLLLLAIILHPG